MLTKREQVKQFWATQARQFKTSPLATVPDRYYRDLEIDRVIGQLKGGADILDIGCGNGFSSVKFLQKFKTSRLVGVDYSPEMILQANRVLGRQASFRRRLQFMVGDVLTLAGLPALRGRKFDYIISERCLINLQNWSEQRLALLQLKRLLKTGGRLILCENTQEGLHRLNKLRRLVKLSPISVRWHNYYFPERKLRPFLVKHFRLVTAENIGSLYYIISRVVYAKLCALQGGEPNYLNPINKIAAQLPSVGEFSANYIFVLTTKHSR